MRVEDAKIIIDFQKFNNNKDVFLKLYEKELQSRAIKNNNDLCYSIEKELFEYLKRYKWSEDNINRINKILFDMEMSRDINKNLKDIEIISKSKKSIKSNFDINKLNTFVCSQLLWDEKDEGTNKEEESTDNYIDIIKKYYKSRFPKRNLTIYNKNSFLVISYNNCKLKIPFNYYPILQNLSETEERSIEELSEKVNMTSTICVYLDRLMT